jgi:hypothetical protein
LGVRVGGECLSHRHATRLAGATSAAIQAIVRIRSINHISETRGMSRSRIARSPQARNDSVRAMTSARPKKYSLIELTWRTRGRPSHRKKNQHSCFPHCDPDGRCDRPEARSNLTSSFEGARDLPESRPLHRERGRAPELERIDVVDRFRGTLRA